MMKRMSWWRWCVIATVVAGGGGRIGEVHAASTFDGPWSVSIMTERGDCGTASMDVIIRNGDLEYAGDPSVTIRGRVAKNGVIRVSVASNSRNANGGGRLSANAGGGTWRGAGSTGACTGRWSAQRH